MQRTSTRRQQMHSCDACRRRKVRCDSVNQVSCSACVKSGVDCKFTVGWRRHKRQAPSPSVSASQNEDDTGQARSDRQDPTVTPSECSIVPPGTSPPFPASQSCTCAESQKQKTGVPPESEVAISLDLAENCLYRFFKDGISSSSWIVFDHWDKMRVAYVGTHISNMSHLIKLDRARQPQFLIYPYPQIRSPLSWQLDLPQNGLHEILQDVNSFPAKEIRDDFVNAFFEKVNPFFPVIDESIFRARYANLENQPPLLLLHAVLLVGAHVSTHPKAMKARHTVKAVLFRRAKCVFDMRHETDRLNLVQAALLFTWHLQNGDTASSNSYFWLGVASRIAFGIGMHRNIIHDPLNPDRMPLSDRRLWRRIWWTLFQVEVMSALEHGRPSTIRLTDFDQDPLSVDDFCEASGTINSKIDFDYCKRNIELCFTALEVIELSAPRAPVQDLESRTSSLNARLVSWMLNLPSQNIHTFAGLNLRLHYHTIVIHLYRFVLSWVSSSTHGYEEARRIGSGACSGIISSLESLHAKEMMSQCHFTAVTALTAAAIHIAKDIQQSLGSIHTMLAVNDLHLLDRVCASAEHLSQYWPNAEGVRKVFRSLLDQYMCTLNGIQEGHGPDESLIEDELGGIQWADILGSSWQMDHAFGVNHSWDATIFESEHEAVNNIS